MDNVTLYDKTIDAMNEFKRLKLPQDDVEQWLGAAHVIINYDAISAVCEPDYTIESLTKLMPPYPVVWVESQVGDSEGKTHPTGVLMAWHNPKTDIKGELKAVRRYLDEMSLNLDNLRWYITLEAFTESKTPMYLATATAFIDKDGVLAIAQVKGQDYPYLYHRRDMTYQVLNAAAGGTMELQAYDVMAESIIESGLYTVDFIMRHKNLALESVEPDVSRQVRRYRKRKGLSLKPHHVIKITSGKGKGETIGAVRHERGVKHRVHTVRGHTREYPDGLFGKSELAGEYFIPAHIRGDRATGAVTKHYEVEETSSDDTQ